MKKSTTLRLTLTLLAATLLSACDVPLIPGI